MVEDRQMQAKVLYGIDMLSDMLNLLVSFKAKPMKLLPIPG